MDSWMAEAVRAIDNWGFSAGRVVVEMVLAGLLVRAIKARFPWPKWLPVVSLGFALLLAGAAFARSGLSWSWVFTFAGEGLAAGAIAGFGNDVLKLVTIEFFKRVPFVGPERAEVLSRILWGKPASEPPSLKPTAGALLFVLMFSVTACRDVRTVLDALGHGAQWLGTVLDVARGGADAYLARHPNAEAADRIAAEERRARAQLAALEALIAGGDAIDEGERDRARAAAVEAYAKLREVLKQEGVLDARPAPGGAETESPAPEPLELPTVDEVAARL